jgi:hypothetical protein
MEKIPRRKKMEKAIKEPHKALLMTRKRIQDPKRIKKRIHP